MRAGEGGGGDGSPLMLHVLPRHVEWPAEALPHVPLLPSRNPHGPKEQRDQREGRRRADEDLFGVLAAQEPVDSFNTLITKYPTQSTPTSARTASMSARVACSTRSRYTSLTRPDA
jgi:hypothetical protein